MLLTEDGIEAKLKVSECVSQIWLCRAVKTGPGSQ